MKAIITLINLANDIFSTIPALAQKNVFYVGHSLVNHNMPRMVSEIAKSKGFTTHTYKEQIINGSPLKNSWSNSHTGENGTNFKTDYTNLFNTLVITEAIPLDNHLQWNQTYLYAHNFCSMAENINVNSTCYIYETWHCIKSGTPEGCSFDAGGNIAWRTRLRTDFLKWESIADSVMKRGMQNKVFVIPAGQAMAALYDSLQAGKIQGYSGISDFFSDNIHLNDIGNYYIACVQFAAIFRQSPVGALANIKNQYGVPYNIPHTNTGLITKLQQMAWGTVCNYGKLGVNCSVQTSVEEVKNDYRAIFPNPANDLLYVKMSVKKYQIINSIGQKISEGELNDNQIYIGNLTSGIYTLLLDNRTLLFVKE